MIRQALTVLLMAAAPARAAEPLDTIVAAFEAEARAPAERARLFIERAGIADLYLIERVTPGRLHLIVNPRQGGAELIVVDGQQWLRTPGGWERSLTTVPAQAPSLVALLRNGLSEAEERPAVAGMRVFVGHVTWTNGSSSDGRLEIRLDGAGLPRVLRFEGTCAGAPCRFHQRTDYDGSIRIGPP